MKTDRCGIYEIRSIATSKRYIGSSRRIRKRWSEHRSQLRRTVHRSPRLQRAWLKHGEANFVFAILEECDVSVLEAREQHWIDALKPDYNSMREVRVITPEQRAKMNAAGKRRAAARTHCPHGHEYTPKNTYYGTSGKTDKRCKRCNADRINRHYHAMTPEQKEVRAAAAEKRQERYRDRMKAYRERTKDHKREYDIRYRAVKNARRRARYAAMSPDEKAAYLLRQNASIAAYRAAKRARA